MSQKTKILLCVDLQNDFVSGSLGTKEAQAIVPNVVERLNSFDGEYVIFTKDTHGHDYLRTKEGEKLPVTHCVRGTDGWELVPPVSEWVKNNSLVGNKRVFIVEKDTFGSVPPIERTTNESTPSSVVDVIDLIFKANGKRDMEIECLGLCTDICLLSNAIIIKAFFHDNAEIIVNSSCSAGVTPDKHKAALEAMSSCQIEVR